MKNKKVLITGASRGLGAVIAADFASKGAHLALASRSLDDLRKVRGGLENFQSHIAIELDICDVASIERALKETMDAFKNIDIVVHAAGGGLGYKNPLLGNNELHKLFSLNLSGPAEINRIVCPAMIERGSGNLVHIGSIASSEAVGSVGYNTVKSGLAAYVRSLGKFLAGKNIIATGVLPGGFICEGNAMDRFNKANPIDYENFIKTRLPRGFMGEAKELLPLLRLLASSDASMMSGCMVPIDAGEGVCYQN
jgi:3-oxoacyl-[acyl-carrier protein] reductase